MMNTLGKIIIILAVVLMGVSFFAEAVLAETFNLEYPDFVNPEIAKTPEEKTTYTMAGSKEPKIIALYNLSGINP